MTLRTERTGSLRDSSDSSAIAERKTTDTTTIEAQQQDSEELRDSRQQRNLQPAFSDAWTQSGFTSDDDPSRLGGEQQDATGEDEDRDCDEDQVHDLAGVDKCPPVLIAR